LGTCARKFASGCVREKGLEVSTRVYETETHKSYSGRAFGGDQTRLHVEDVRVKEAIGLVVISVILTIKSGLDGEDIWFGVSWYQTPNLLITNPFPLNIYSVFSLPESDPQILALIIRACKILAIDFHILLRRILHRTILW